MFLDAGLEGPFALRHHLRFASLGITRCYIAKDLIVWRYIAIFHSCGEGDSCRVRPTREGSAIMIRSLVVFAETIFPSNIVIVKLKFGRPRKALIGFLWSAGKCASQPAKRRSRDSICHHDSALCFRIETQNSFKGPLPLSHFMSLTTIRT
jgi:hypothetical protein